MTKALDAMSIYFTNLINASTKTQDEIAREAGFKSANTVSMIKTGRTKLPIARIPALAKALGSDPIEMLEIAMKTYMPEIFDVYATIMPGMLISQREYKLIQEVRKAAGVGMLT